MWTDKLTTAHTKTSPGALIAEGVSLCFLYMLQLCCCLMAPRWRWLYATRSNAYYGVIHRGVVSETNINITANRTNIILAGLMMILLVRLKMESKINFTLDFSLNFISAGQRWLARTGRRAAVRIFLERRFRTRDNRHPTVERSFPCYQGRWKWGSWSESVVCWGFLLCDVISE